MQEVAKKLGRVRRRMEERSAGTVPARLLTHSGEWPQICVEQGDQPWPRPAILEF